jgi:hypothetical protein
MKEKVDVLLLYITLNRITREQRFRLIRNMKNRGDSHRLH